MRAGPALTGSSPLARGLHRSGRVRRRTRRIIPARAGFTVTELRAEHDHEDHPRSRGVYDRLNGAHHNRGGSSPLARGLPRTDGYTYLELRIIPARAGFTIGGGGFTSSAKDHPRSRGVYRHVDDAVAGEKGSSPLARGLLCSSRNFSAPPRIIPARAGFTLGRRS